MDAYVVDRFHILDGDQDQLRSCPSQIVFIPGFLKNGDPYTDI